MSRANIVLEAESFEAVSEEEVTKETKEKSNTENGVYVKGMALPFGSTSRNGVQYERESVKENHGDLVGRTMLFNHKQDWVTGHILNTEITEDGMFFEGDINPNAEMPNGVPVAEAIERGDINSVSIQAFVEQMGEEADEDAVIGEMDTEKVQVRDFLEISAVSIPGFPEAEALPEHLQKQGVKPVTEMVSNTENKQKEYSEKDADDFDDVGECISFHMDQMDMDQDQAVAVCMDKMESEESLENPEFEVGEFVQWEFGDGTSQGEIIDMTAEVGDSMSAGGNEFTIEDGDGPLYKIEEWDETQGDNGAFTNNVVKFEDALSSTDRPENAEREKLTKEQYEFSPVPTHVLYDNEEDAKRRAENLGLEGIHEHSLNDQLFYMAGENHDAWLNAIDRENPLDRGEDNTMGDKEDPEENSSAESDKKSEQVTQEAFIDFVAEHMEGLDSEDVANAVGDSNFTGLDQGEVAKLLAMEFELDTDTVMDAIGSLEDMEGEGYDNKDDDEDEDESTEETEEEDSETEEEGNEESREELEDKIKELENRIEKLIENDEGSSKQEGPASEDLIERRPSFKDSLN